LSFNDLPTLHVLTGVLTAASCLSVITALLVYLWRMRHREGGFVGATTLMCVFVMTLGVSTIVRFLFTTDAPVPGVIEVTEFVIASVIFCLGFMVWPLVPTLVNHPTRRELVEVNRRLVTEQSARQIVVSELRSLNQQLENRVADRTAELDAARRRFEIALAGSEITVSEQNRDLRYVWVHNAPSWLAPSDTIGRMPEDLLSPDTAASLRALKKGVIDNGKSDRFELAFDTPEGRRWYEGRVEPLMVGNGVGGVLTVAIDITRHKQHEHEVREILRELTHRSKNLLSVVQIIAHQSRIGISDVDGFLGPFVARLMTLSVVHEMLIDNLWRGATLGDVIWRVRGRTPGGLSLACEAEGPEILLMPELVQNVALAIHELLVDAIGHSPASARVAILWRHQPGATFEFECHVAGRGDGPLNAFCQLILQTILPRAVNGNGVVTLGEGEFLYRLMAPSDRLIVVATP
jgi:two-component sensor histidine kinase/PAS domain-containing protein